MMGTDYPNRSGLSERDFFAPVQEWLRSSDLRMGNFEGTLYDGEQNPDGKVSGANRHLFRTPTLMANHLMRAGFNFLSLANNHAKDFGRVGLESTKQALRAQGISFSSKDGEVATFNIKGTSVAILSGGTTVRC